MVLALLGAQMGCTAPQPASLELDVQDPAVAAQAEAAFPAARTQPEVRPEGVAEAPETLPPEPVVPSIRPHVAVIPDPHEADEDSYQETCPVRIVATGFPAISADGSTIVLDEFEVDDASTNDMDGLRSIWFIDAKPGGHSAIHTLADGYAYNDAAEAHPEIDPCIAYADEAERAAPGINRALKKQDWRPLHRLDVVMTDPYEEADEDDPTNLRSIEASVRPVEMYWKANRLIARTPGVKVYLDIAAPWGNDASNYDPGEDEAFDVDKYSPCDYEPLLGSVHGDAVSGTLLLEYGYDRSVTSCLCDGGSYTKILQAPPAFFKRLDHLASRKPTPAATD